MWQQCDCTARLRQSLAVKARYHGRQVSQQALAAQNPAVLQVPILAASYTKAAEHAGSNTDMSAVVAIAGPAAACVALVCPC